MNFIRAGVRHSAARCVCENRCVASVVRCVALRSVMLEAPQRSLVFAPVLPRLGDLIECVP